MDLEVLIRDTVRAVLREELRSALAEFKARAPGEYLTVAQAAEVAQVAPDTVLRWLGNARLKGSRAGARWRVRRDEIDRFLSEPQKSGLTPEEAAARALARHSR